MKIKQPNLKSLQVYNSPDYEGSAIVLAQGRSEIMIERESLPQLTREMVRGSSYEDIEFRLNQAYRDLIVVMDLAIIDGWNKELKTKARDINKVIDTLECLYFADINEEFIWNNAPRPDEEE